MATETAQMMDDENPEAIHVNVTVLQTLFPNGQTQTRVQGAGNLLETLQVLQSGQNAIIARMIQEAMGEDDAGTQPEPPRIIVPKSGLSF